MVHPSPRPVNARTACVAAQRRRSRKERAKYAALQRFCVVLVAGLALVLSYVMLTARLTSLNYAVARAQRERAGLAAESARLDDRLAALRSDEHLAAMAARLHMQDPQQFAQVTLPLPMQTPRRSRLAFFAGLASFFGAR